MMKGLLEKEGFLKALFDAIPMLTLLVDSEGSVQAINDAATNLLGMSAPPFHPKRPGDLLQCIHSKDVPQGCGFGPHCEICVVRKTAMEAIHGNVVRRAKGKLEVHLEGKDRVLSVLISSAPMTYQGQRFSMVIVEDLSTVTELQGLLPLCASCKKIRDDQGYWNRLEKYIQEHSEAEFTHGICPDCVKKLYPELSE
jgi:hypothetical protein